MTINRDKMKIKKVGSVCNSLPISPCGYKIVTTTYACHGKIVIMSRNIRAKNLVIRQANALTTAAYSLTRNEKRLIYIGLDSIINQKKAEPNKYGQIPVDIIHSEYLSMFNDDGTNTNRDISKAAIGLQKKEVTFYVPSEDGDDGEKAYDALNWAVKRSVRPKRGITTVFFNSELVSIIADVNRNFTRFLIGEAGNLKTAYAMRLYESIQQWANSRGTITFNVAWMMERYGLPTSYTRMSDFRRRFLKPAVADINLHTSTELTYEEVKEGSTVVSIKFFFTSPERDKKTTNSTSKRDKKTTDPLGAAVETYSDIVQKSNLPSLHDIDNLMIHIPKLRDEGFVFDEAFYSALLAAQECSSVK